MMDVRVIGKTARKLLLLQHVSYFVMLLLFLAGSVLVVLEEQSLVRITDSWILLVILFVIAAPYSGLLYLAIERSKPLIRIEPVVVRQLVLNTPVANSVNWYNAKQLLPLHNYTDIGETVYEVIPDAAFRIFQSLSGQSEKIRVQYKRLRFWEINPFRIIQYVPGDF